MGALQRTRTQAPQRTSSNTTPSPIRAQFTNHQESPILGLQRAIGNQAVSRLLQADSARVPGTEPGRESNATPPIVHEVLNSPGQPLDSAMRAFMEPRFGHDFSNVRIHADERAAQSAHDVRAAAYTVGNHAVFAPDTYRPGTASGHRLIAHELAHVVQQQNTNSPPQAMPEIGHQDDRAEQEADAAAHAALATAHLPGPDASRWMPPLSAFPSGHPLLQRAPVETWAGKFEADPYNLLKPERGSGVEKGLSGYGAHIEIEFTPNAKVNAEEIAFVQTAQTLIDGTPQIRPNDPKQITKTRMIDEFSPGRGIQIDVGDPSVKMPLVGMADPKGNDLSDATPNRLKIAEIGWNSKTKHPPVKAATMADEPSWAVPDKSEASQVFETTALAIAGTQKGAYYGSVAWGWSKSATSLDATLTKFQVASKDVPSSEYHEVAKMWNESKTSEGKDTIPLPLVAGMFTIPKKTELMEDPVKPKPISLGDLKIHTRLEVIEPADPKDVWRHVIVIDGPLAGKVGWVKATILTERQSTP
jgi:hypothetical protein